MKSHSQNNSIKYEKTLSPKLFLAPMEGLGALPFRKAIATIGGFDEGCCEFIRIPSTGFSPSLLKGYDPNALSPITQAAQIMGGVKEYLAEAAAALEQLGAPRIDLNCGCPSNTVTGRGAGSSLLKNPKELHAILSMMVKSVKIPVTAKLRSGYSDTSLFEENLLAAEEAGVKFITLHPRTKEDGYARPANWDLIAKAKELLKVPVVGNGDILSVSDALSMLTQTNCDALMIGRGAVINPWIFLEIKSHFNNESLQTKFSELEVFINTFCTYIDPTSKQVNKVNHFKQLISFLFRRSTRLMSKKIEILKKRYEHLDEMKKDVLLELEKEF